MTRKLSRTGFVGHVTSFRRSDASFVGLRRHLVVAVLDAHLVRLDDHLQVVGLHLNPELRLRGPDARLAPAVLGLLVQPAASLAGIFS